MDGVDGDTGDKGDKGDPGTPGEKGDPGPSNAYADGPNSATLDNNLSTVASVEVPAGSYVVSASVRVANGFTSNANGLPTCFVATGSGGSIPRRQHLSKRAAAQNRHDFVNPDNLLHSARDRGSRRND